MYLSLKAMIFIPSNPARQLLRKKKGEAQLHLMCHLIFLDVVVI